MPFDRQAQLLRFIVLGIVVVVDVIIVVGLLRLRFATVFANVAIVVAGAVDMAFST